MKKLVNYIKEAYIELRDKVTWPSWADLQSSSVVVLIASIIIALILLGMDMVSKNMMEFYYDAF